MTIFLGFFWVLFTVCHVVFGIVFPFSQIHRCFDSTEEYLELPCTLTFGNVIRRISFEVCGQNFLFEFWLKSLIYLSVSFWSKSLIFTIFEIFSFVVFRRFWCFCFLLCWGNGVFLLLLILLAVPVYRFNMLRRADIISLQGIYFKKKVVIWGFICNENRRYNELRLETMVKHIRRNFWENKDHKTAFFNQFSGFLIFLRLPYKVLSKETVFKHMKKFRCKTRDVAILTC